MRSAKSSSGVPHARWVQPSPAGWRAAPCGRVDRRRRAVNGRRERRVVLAAPPTTSARSRRRASASVARPVRRVRGHGEHRLAAWPRGRRAARRSRCRAGRAWCAAAARRRSRRRVQVAVELAAARPARELAGSPSTSIAPRAAGLRLAQDQPRRDGAVPAVDLQAHGGVGGLVGRDRQRRAVAEGTQRERAPPALSVKRTWRPSPSARGSVSVRGRDEQRDRRVALPERGELLELLGEVERQRVALGDRVDPDLGHEVLGREHLVGVLEERVRGTRRPRRARSSGPPPPCGRRSGAGGRRRRAGRRAGRRPGSSGRSRCPPRRRARSGSPGGGGARRSARRRSRSRPGASPRPPARARCPAGARRPAPRPRSGSGSRRRGARC